MDEPTFIEVVGMIGAAVLFGTAFVNQTIVKTVGRWREKELAATVYNILLGLFFLALIAACLFLVRTKVPPYAFPLAAVVYGVISVVTWRFWENDRSAFYIMAQLFWGYLLWAGVSIAFFVFAKYGAGLGILVFVCFAVPVIWTIVSAHRTYQKYRTVEKRFIRAIEISGPQALVLHDPYFRLWYIFPERVPFVRRWWRVAVMALAMGAIILAASDKQWNTPGGIVAGLLICTIGIEYTVRKWRVNGGACLLNGLVWIVFGMVTLFNPGEPKAVFIWVVLGVVLTPTTFLVLLYDAITKRAV